MKHLTTPNAYQTLITKISRELSGLEFFIKHLLDVRYLKLLIDNE